MFLGCFWEVFGGGFADGLGHLWGYGWSFFEVVRTLIHIIQRRILIFGRRAQFLRLEPKLRKT